MLIYRIFRNSYLIIFLFAFLSLGINSCGSPEKSSSDTSGSDSDSAPSSTVRTSEVSSGSSQCTYGGVKIEVGIDDNKNGILDESEVDNTKYVCNGESGVKGDNGTAGSSGLVSLLSSETESAGSNCANGGNKFNYGIDDNNDGVLDSTEIDGFTFVCNGDSGTAGDNGTYHKLKGFVQKGPYIQGTEINVREMFPYIFDDNSTTLIFTGKTYTGIIEDDLGSFSIKGILDYNIVELSAMGYYFNEVTGSLSNSNLNMQALSDLNDNSSINVNLMTHLEKKRVEYLMDNGSTLKAAKEKVQGEILKIFNIDNVSIGKSESLDISKSGVGNAVLLAISAILQSDKSEAQLTELLSNINTDIRTDGTLDSNSTKQKLITAVDYLKPIQSNIRSNIENRYSSLGISATIPNFESYVLKLDTVVPTVSSTTPVDNSTTFALNLPLKAVFNDHLVSSKVTSSNFFLKDNSTNLITSSVSYDNKTATLTPSSNLVEQTNYTVTLKSEITDLAGNKLDNYSWSFKTGDFTNPVLSQVANIIGSIDFNPNDQGANPLTNDNTPSLIVNSNESGTLTTGGPCSLSNSSVTSGNNTITFNTLSDGNWGDYKQGFYTSTVNGTQLICTLTITDLSGNVGNTITLTQFSIQSGPPNVTSKQPNGTSESISSKIYLSFYKQKMDPDSFTTNTSNTSCSGTTFQVSSDNFSNCVQMSSQPVEQQDGQKFEVTPVSNLSANTTYNVRATTGIKDIFGVALSTTWTESFKTAP